MKSLLAQASAVVFDLDGTLVDSRGDIAAAANHTLKAHGFSELSEDEIASYVGDGARHLLARASRLNVGSSQLGPLLETFLDYYTAHAVVRTRPMAGAADTLEALQPLPLALCTNKPRATTDALLSALGWEQAFDVVVGGGDVTRSKPDPEPLLRIAAALEVAPKTLVMVGDGPQDILCGKSVGCATVGIVGNIVPEQRLLASRPDMLIHHLTELLALLPLAPSSRSDSAR